MTLIESDGVKVENVATALPDAARSTFGDGSGKWADVRSLCWRLGIYESQAGVRGCLRYLEEQGRARRHPSGADYWQAVT